MIQNNCDTLLASTSPLPMCIVDAKGKVVSASKQMEKVILYGGIEGADTFALMCIKYDQLLDAALNEKHLKISRNQKTFEIIPSVFGDQEEGTLCLYFLDVTEREELENKYNEEKTCIAVVDIDNFDELISSTDEHLQSGLVSEIDKRIRRWGANMNASVTKCKSHMYVMIFTRGELDKAARSKFNILDEVREIETQADFPVTLSIGVGIEGDSLEETDHYALQALDVAKGRGGDQAVVKVEDDLSYYGGKTQTVEKENKGKSRIIGHALCGLIESASSVMIMGHKNPDMDCFSSSMGIYKLAKSKNHKTYIVLDQHNEGLEVMYEKAMAKGEYEIIKSKKALAKLKDRSLVIVLDTQRPCMTECPELLELADRIVVIDHHRKSEDAIEEATLAYTEPYASSTAELVTEILQYTMDRRAVTNMEATALLAGIMVDTNRFSVKTGVRTFEAAAWLKRAGADTAEAKRLFQTGLDSFRIRSAAIAAAEIGDKGFAYASWEGENPNAQIINAQAADELLTVRGVKATFVAGKDHRGKTIVSARSIGNLNVQLVMEHFGGGGHLNTAGAQVDSTPRQVISEIREIMENEK